MKSQAMADISSSFDMEIDFILSRIHKNMLEVRPQEWRGLDPLEASKKIHARALQVQEWLLSLQKKMDHSYMAQSAQNNHQLKTISYENTRIKLELEKLWNEMGEPSFEEQENSAQQWVDKTIEWTKKKADILNGMEEEVEEQLQVIGDLLRLKKEKKIECIESQVKMRQQWNAKAAHLCSDVQQNIREKAEYLEMLEEKMRNLETKLTEQKKKVYDLCFDLHQT